MVGELVKNDLLFLSEGIEVIEVGVEGDAVGMVAVVKLAHEVDICVDLLELGLEDGLVGLEGSDDLIGILRHLKMYTPWCKVF